MKQKFEFFFEQLNKLLEREKIKLFPHKLNKLLELLKKYINLKIYEKNEKDYKKIGSIKNIYIKELVYKKT